MADEEVAEVEAPAPAEEVEMSVLDALKDVSFPQRDGTILEKDRKRSPSSTFFSRFLLWPFRTFPFSYFLFFQKKKKLK